MVFDQLIYICNFNWKFMYYKMGNNKSILYRS